MTSTTHIFGGNQVAFIVRGKTSHDHEPDLMAQHADCVLVNGAPVGFYGTGNTGSSGGSSSGFGASSKSSANSSNSSGFAMSGVVFDFAELARLRAPYVDAGIARATNTISTVLFVPVSAAEAKAFEQAWAEMRKKPGMFSILGGNCSTHAAKAFQQAHILSGGIPGLDTPNNLYKQLWREKGGKVTTESGYVGFKPLGSGYVMTIDQP